MVADNEVALGDGGPSGVLVIAGKRERSDSDFCERAARAAVDATILDDTGKNRARAPTPD